jgi:hypothetical protein
MTNPKQVILSPFNISVNTKYHRGTKVAPYLVFHVPAQGSVVINCRMYADSQRPSESFGPSFEEAFDRRKAEGFFLHIP